MHCEKTVYCVCLYNIISNICVSSPHKKFVTIIIYREIKIYYIVKKFTNRYSKFKELRDTSAVFNHYKIMNYIDLPFNQNQDH